jgi:hypothetical protein
MRPCRHAADRGTVTQSSPAQKNYRLARGLQYVACNSVSMTASYQHHLRRSGAAFTKAGSQQRCAVMRPVVISVWNKKTGAGNQN